MPRKPPMTVETYAAASFDMAISAAMGLAAAANLNSLATYAVLRSYTLALEEAILADARVPPEVLAQAQAASYDQAQRLKEKMIARDAPMGPKDLIPTRKEAGHGRRK